MLTPKVDPKLREGREAVCSCGARRPSSDMTLAFYEYRGPGSAAAEDGCKHCMYYKCAHERQPKLVDPSSCVERGECKGFEPHGAHETDTFYCGCGGWD